MPDFRRYYRDHPAQFIADYGMTTDPRGQPATVPFIPFPMQCSMIEFVLTCWRAQTPGLIEKSRDVGASVVAMALAETLFTFHPRRRSR